MAFLTIEDKAWTKLCSDITSILAAQAYTLDGQNKLIEETAELRRMAAEAADRG